MASLQDIRSVALRAIGNMVLSDGGTTTGTVTASKVKTTATLVSLYDGQFKSLAAAEFVVAAPTSTQMPVGHERWALYNMTTAGPAAAKTFYVVVALDSANAPVFFQGSYEGQDLSFRGMPLQKGDGLIPQIPDGFLPFAILKMAFSTGASTFTWGTTSPATAGNLTATYYDIAVLPSTTTL